MKKLLMILLLLVPVQAVAWDEVVFHDSDATQNEINFNIDTCGDECMQVETRSGTVYRIYACGRLEKLTWKELNPNEEVSSGSYITESYVLPPYNGDVEILLTGDNVGGVTLDADEMRKLKELIE